MKITETINYGIFRFTYSLKGMVLKSVPQRLVPIRTNLNSILQIAVTTYVDRYDSFLNDSIMSYVQMIWDWVLSYCTITQWD